MKRILLGTVALYVCILAATVFTATTSAQGGDSRIQRGFEVAPVPLTMKGLNPALVAPDPLPGQSAAPAPTVTPEATPAETPKPTKTPKPS